MTSSREDEPPRQILRGPGKAKALIFSDRVELTLPKGATKTIRRGPAQSDEDWEWFVDSLTLELALLGWEPEEPVQEIEVSKEELRWCDRVWEEFKEGLLLGDPDAARILSDMKRAFPNMPEWKLKRVFCAIMQSLNLYGPKIPLKEGAKIFDRWGVGDVFSRELLYFLFGGGGFIEGVGAD